VTACIGLAFDEFDFQGNGTLLKFSRALKNSWNVKFKEQWITVDLHDVRFLPQPELGLVALMHSIEQFNGSPMLTTNQSWLFRKDGSSSESLVFDCGGSTAEVITYKVDETTGKFSSFNIATEAREGFWYTAIPILKDFLVKKYGNRIRNMDNWAISNILVSGYYKNDGVSEIIDEVRRITHDKYYHLINNSIPNIASLDRIAFIGRGMLLLKDLPGAFQDLAKQYHIDIITPPNPGTCATLGAYYGAVSMANNK
jgi:hypothetical protein